MTSITNSSIKLPRYESFIYFSLWIGAVLYSVYNVYLINPYFNYYDDLYGDFAPGWSWIGRKRDISDQEWRMWIPLLIKLAPWIFLHHFISQTIKILINSMVNQVYDVLKLSNVRHLAFNLVRYIFWIFFTNFFLHFMYFNAVQYHPELVRSLNPWALYGLGYCLGQFFLIKYVVVYGLNHTLCAIDCVKAPPQPKCVARIHLYSDMWKYFDQGLYKFLVRYIYVPLLKSNFNKLIASFLCFTFVFIWHGMQTNIFIWAFMNFIGLNVESSIKSAERSKSYLNVHKRYMSKTNIRRLNCILTSPLLAVSVISNFYFFAGEEIGHIYIYEILHDTWYTTFILLFFLYCCCQVSIDIKSWELKRYSNLKQ
ncbi:protein-cysteine N-palmitoyltransferase HHAT isoform X4 [Ceratina calcarata]|uniref:Protein-cysteine N-palmitoyltransferase HHAT isoform X4 n=1 Tax=Ceratina calcarata TaxID=156304 RepID=A0AAJ7N3Z1_9HYME|nr:protein-cysteine N-palmitoyltransferase HHAT isoform X4 [Ceratina calcarata]